MANEVSVSRKTLRRAIAKEARLTFFRRYPDGEVTVTGGPDTDVPTTSAFECTALTQGDSFWVGGWAYIYSDTAGAGNVGIAGEERLITGFASDSNKVTVEHPYSAAPKVNAKLEILDIWSAGEIHEAINKAIRLGGRSFSDVFEDDSTFCVVADRLEYDLSALGTAPRSIVNVWIEQPTSYLSGTADSVAATTVEVNAWAGDLTNADTDWWLSIYDGTGKGQTRRFASINDDSGTVTVATWATNPDTTSKLIAWNGDSQIVDWYHLDAFRLDQRESPNFLRLLRTYSEFEGFRIRIQSLISPPALTGDTSTTVVPQDYIIYKALSHLHDKLVGDNKVDRQLHASMAEYYDQLSKDFERQFMRRLPSRKLRRQEAGAGYPQNVDDPLGWWD